MVDRTKEIYIMVKIIVDSAADFTQEQGAELGIKIVPLTIHCGGKEYEDGVTIANDDFYKMLIESSELPKTMQVNPYKWTEAIEEFENDEIVIITLSKKLSGTYQSAVLAAKSFENVYVVDSESATVGEKILAYRALELVKDGKSAKEIAEILDEEKKTLCLIALVDTLEYLKKGGRISATAAFFGGMLGIKPVIEVKDGKIATLGKAKGSKMGNNKLREQIKKYNGIDFSKPYGVGYSGLSDILLKKYIEDSKDIYGEREIEITNVGSTIGTHVGPGCIAVAFFRNK